MVGKISCRATKIQVFSADFSTAAGGGRREKSKGAAVGRDRGACDEGKCREPQVGSPSAPAKKTGQSKTVLFFIQSEGLVCNPA